MPAGYSPNPLIKKLGIKEGYWCLIINEPDHYFDLLEEIPTDSDFTDDPSTGEFDFIHVFATDIHNLADWSIWKKALRKTGMIWVS